MSEPFRPSVRELLILLVVAVAAVTGIAFLVNDIRQPPTNYCIAVEDGVAANIAGSQLLPIKAVAARDPWIANRSPEPFANYYVVAIQVTTPDGSTGEGLWGVGTNAPAPAEGAALSFDQDHAVITALDPLAVEHTNWPDTSLPFESPGTPASRAQECLIR
ncbi:hypothetical protein [Tomitella biformata]|uniref:hypothetical protein n=1 Tax=Tomitella biformata TaxID=630403 RepID=UPI000466C45A|nr:hypothetical protein [Tomitella biformata]